MNGRQTSSPEMMERVVAINRVSKVVKGGKRFRFSVLVVVGDGESKVGVGMGKAREISEREGLDTILIDAPPGIGCALISSISGVSDLLIVTEPSISAKSDLNRTLELLENYSSKKYVVINKYDLSPDLTTEVEELCKIYDVRVIGKIPFDRVVVDAMVNRKSIIEFNPDSVVSIELKKIWNTINSYKY